jgi:hypothetical protein
MSSKKRRRSGDGGGDGGGGGRQVSVVPGGHGLHYNDTNVIVMASDNNRRNKRVHSNCNNSDNGIIELVARESPRGKTMPPVSEQTMVLMNVPLSLVLKIICRVEEIHWCRRASSR